MAQHLKEDITPEQIQARQEMAPVIRGRIQSTVRQSVQDMLLRAQIAGNGQIDAIEMLTVAFASALSLELADIRVRVGTTAGGASAEKKIVLDA